MICGQSFCADDSLELSFSGRFISNIPAEIPRWIHVTTPAGDSSNESIAGRERSSRTVWRAVAILVFIVVPLGAARLGSMTTQIHLSTTRMVGIRAQETVGRRLSGPLIIYGTLHSVNYEGSLSWVLGRGLQESPYFLVVSDFDVELDGNDGEWDSSDRQPSFTFRGKEIAVPLGPPPIQYLLTIPEAPENNVFILRSDGTLTKLKGRLRTIEQLNRFVHDIGRIAGESALQTLEKILR